MDKRPSTDEQVNKRSLLNKIAEKCISIVIVQDLAEQDAKKHVQFHCGNILLIFVAVLCTLGALTSAFNIAVNTSTLISIWLITAIAVSIISVRYRVKGLLLLFVPVLIIMLFNITTILDGGMWSAYTITTEYSRWMPFVVLFPEMSYYEIEMSYYMVEPTAFVATVGVIITFILGFTICLRRSVFMTMATTVPVLFITFVVTTSQPNLIYFFGLVAVYLTMLISSCLGPDNFIKRAMVVAPSFAIALVIMTLTYIIVPFGSHVRDGNIVDLGNRFRMFASQMNRIGQFFGSSRHDGTGTGWFGILGGGNWQFNTDHVSIADAGSRDMLNRNLLEITVSEPGIFYIRGYSMDYFDGRSWINNEVDGSGEFERTARNRPAYIAAIYSRVHPETAPALVEMEIRRTGDVTYSVTYEPYFTADFLRDEDVLNTAERFFYIPGSVHAMASAVEEWLLDRGAIAELYNDEIIIAFGHVYVLRVPSVYSNEYNYYDAEWLYLEDFQDLRDYAISSELYLEETWDLLEEIWALHDHAASSELLFVTNAERAFINNRYTQIDAYTAQALRQIALQAGIDPYADHPDIADAVARFVRSSGVYTLTPGSIPEDEDFAVYFLQSLQEGFCIHFATVAVLMLRSLDIPARFVTGYAIRVSSDDVGVPIIVTDMNAHAWVEVYYDGIGWLYLEATPSAGNTYVPPPRPHSPENVWQLPTPDQWDTEYIPRDYHMNGVSAMSDAGEDSEIPEIFMPQLLRVTVIATFLIGVPVFVIALRRFVMGIYRAKCFKEENTNLSVIFAWRYIMKLSANKPDVPKDLEELALRARFSRHQITEEERTRVVRYARQLAHNVYDEKSTLHRIWFRYVRGLN